jgi:hypothetical protein
MKRTKGFYNSTKKRALEILEDQEWIDVPKFARKADIRPTRRAYTYLIYLGQLNLNDSLVMLALCPAVLARILVPAPAAYGQREQAPKE